MSKSIGILFGFCLTIGLVIVLWAVGARPVKNYSSDEPDLNLLEWSQQLLYHVKTDEPIDSLESLLTSVTKKRLQTGLPNDDSRKVFWINLYNAYYQIFALRNSLTRPKIFTEKKINFADLSLSLDDLEHGILRRYRWKLSMGYLPQFLPSKSIKQLAVHTIDFRIHFALNCGAKSCPPIAFYSYPNINNQLEVATRAFLKNETDVFAEEKKVYVTKIMQWFKGDFGGNTGIKTILATYLEKDFTGYTINFKKYEWTDELNNFQDDTK